MTTDTPIAEAPKLLTYREAGDILSVTAKTIYNLAKRGELPSVRFGSNVRIDLADVKKFIEKSKGVSRG